MNKENKIKYFLYARKSSESTDRQTQSIENQISTIKEMARVNKFEIVDVLSESKSAKKPDNRPIFSAMLERIKKGEANGILCWEINRLTRNPVDGGKIQWMLQQGIIESIRTISREYKPSDNALILSVESGTANQYIIDLKRGVKRGLDNKLDKGMAPMLAPLGYLNTKSENRGENYIKKDPERFDLIRKIWDLMLTSKYSATKILAMANDKWGLRTRKTKRKGGKPMSRSTIYRILTDPFYAGQFKYAGKIYPGKHEPMITLAEFDKVQVILGREGKPRPKVHEFPFTGIMHCGECGSAITAINKTKVIKKTGEVKTFTYYYCTRRKNSKCTQGAYITSDDLDQQIYSEVEKVALHPAFFDVAMEIIRDSHGAEIKENTKIDENQSRTISETKKQIDNLTEMRCRELINDEEYIEKKKQLQNSIVVLEQRQKESGTRAVNWLSLTEQALDFATNVCESFKTTKDFSVKKEILFTIGENQTLNDKKVFIPKRKWLIPIESNLSVLKSGIEALELENNHNAKGRKEVLTSLRPLMRS